MLLSGAREIWLEHRVLYKANKTTRNDERTTRVLVEIIGDMQVHNVTPALIDKYFRSRKVSTATINMEMSVLRQFFLWCVQSGYCRTSPLAHLHKLKDMGRKKYWVPVSDFSKLLDSATHPRNRMLVALALYLLLRSSEMKTLRVGDVLLDDGRIDVTVWKTRERDVMELSVELEREVRRWLAFYASQVDLSTPEAKDYFFVPRLSRPVMGFNRDTRTAVKVADGCLLPTEEVSSLFDVFKPILQRAGYDHANTAAHALRRSGARAFYEALVDAGMSDALEIVQSTLHHKTRDITERYIGVTPAKASRNKRMRGQVMYPAAEGAGIRELRLVK